MPEHAREVEAIRSAKTLAELQAVVNGFPAEAAGDGGVLYSRPVGTMQSQLIALEVAKQTGLQIIDDTPRAKFLVFAEKEIKKAAERIFIGNGYSIEETEIKTSGFLYGDVKSLSNRHKSMVDRYLIDIYRMVRESKRVLRAGGIATFVVGNSCLRGVYIRNAEAVAVSAELCGFKPTRRYERELPSRSRYLPVGAGSALGNRMRSETLLSFAA